MKQKNKEQNHNKKYIAIEILAGILVSLGIFLFLYLRGYQPAGEDVYGHLYKVEFLGENIKKGVLFPLYTEDWYNGFQMFRYWPIFAYYVMAIC